MPDATTTRGPSIFQSIFIAVAAALIAGGTAPWWWDKAFPPDASDPSGNEVAVVVDDDDEPDDRPDDTGNPDDDPDTDGPDTDGPDTDDTDPDDEVVTEATGCRIVIENPLVTLFEEPDSFGLEVGRVATGTYPVDRVTTVTFAGKAERWFLITADGRSGWLRDNTILIASKSADCP